MKLLCIRNALELNIGQVVALELEQARHLRDVLRIEKHQLFWARTAQSDQWRYQMAVHVLNKREVQLQVVTKEQVKPSSPTIELIQGYPKASRFDDVLRMNIEAGVSRVRPVITEYGQLSKGAGVQKSERWQRIACEAIEQSGNLSYTASDELIGLKQFFLQEPCTADVLEVVAHPPYLSTDVNFLTLTTDYLQQFRVIRVFVGSEGGFSAEEIELFRTRLAVFYRFGDTILRTEHAGLYAVAGVQTLLQHKEVRN